MNERFKRAADGRLWYRAADMLEGDQRPVTSRRNPLYKAAGIPAQLLQEGAYLPAWNWQHPRKHTPNTEVIDLDVNAAYLAAASGAPFAHGGHDHTGPQADLQVARPGYYKIDAHHWQVDIIVSPLGSANVGADGMVWVAAPTVVLLAELAEQGYWPGLDIHDSYTAPVACRLRKWTDAIKADRASVLDDLRFDPDDKDAKEQYLALKNGYAVAIEMLATPYGAEKKSRYYRPDWFDTIHAQHAASTWRKAWKAALMGNSPVAMGDVDELTFTPADLAEIMSMAKPPFKIDETGAALGSLKTKRVYALPGTPETTGATL